MSVICRRQADSNITPIQEIDITKPSRRDLGGGVASVLGAAALGSAGSLSAAIPGQFIAHTNRETVDKRK